MGSWTHNMQLIWNYKVSTPSVLHVDCIVVTVAKDIFQWSILALEMGYELKWKTIIPNNLWWMLCQLMCYTFNVFITFPITLCRDFYFILMKAYNWIFCIIKILPQSGLNEQVRVQNYKTYSHYYYPELNSVFKKNAICKVLTISYIL